jgi:small conductance mechanosensitive channel
MENPFRDIDWNSIKDWFSEQGIWFLVTIVVAAIFYLAMRRWTRRLVKSILTRLKVAPTDDEVQKLSNTISRVVTWLGTGVIVVATVFAVLPRFGVDITFAGEAIGSWLGTHGVRIAIILAIAIIAHQITKRLIHRLVEGSVIKEKRRRAKEELKKRVDTLSHFLDQVVVAVIWLAATFMIISELGVNIGPLLAGAGIAGIAIGFGAQNLIRDVITGMFIIMENQYGKGDVVAIAGTIGLVEEVNMRRTILRDLDGIVHVVPNGEIKVASNYTRDYSRVNLNISVAYGEDLDRAIEVINQIGQEMAEEDAWKRKIITPPQVLRVDNLGDSGIDIKILGDTKPLEQWAIMGELRLRLKRVFDEEGIEIPWPHTKVFFGSELPKDEGQAGIASPSPTAPSSRLARIPEDETVDAE